MESSERVSPVAEPPPLASINQVALLSGIGIGFTAIAALLGAIFPAGDVAAGWVNDTLAPLRAIGCLVGLVIAGSAITLRPRWFGGWLLASLAFLLAGCGFPHSWYTLSFASFAFAAVGAIATGLAALPFPWRVAVASALPVLHFSGIVTAVLSPPPAPELINQAWVVVSRPYLQFAYLNNAYQFYSPDPGSASELWFCIEYETRPTDPVLMEVLQYDNNSGQPLRDSRGELLYLPRLDENDEPTGEPIFDQNGTLIFKPEKDRNGNDMMRPIYDDDLRVVPRYLKKYEWVKMPRRPQDRKDPLFQTYYRRLSLTENVSQGATFSQMPLSTQLDLRRRRYAMTPEANFVARDKQIPLNEQEWSIDVQYRMPSEMIQDLLLPSYARHIAKEKAQKSDRAVAGIKIYRVLHAIVRIDLFVGNMYDDKRQPWSAYDPATYLPYYVGDFDVNGKLRNPGDPMLYWLVPISRRTDLSPAEYTKPLKKMSEFKRRYIDYVSAHAGSNHMVGELQK